MTIAQVYKTDESIYFEKLHFRRMCLDSENLSTDLGTDDFF